MNTPTDAEQLASMLADMTGATAAAEASRKAAQAEATRAAMTNVDQLYQRGVAEARAKLATSFHDPSAVETILIDLAAREVPVALSLIDAQRKLIAKLHVSMDNSSAVRTLARALHDVTAVSHAISRRVEGLLGAATNLRAQRRMLDFHGGRDDK